MGFLDEKGLRTLTNSLVQGDTVKVNSEFGYTVSDVINNLERECDNVSVPISMEIENDLAEFKVGQGKNINVSGDTENGFTTLSLAGISKLESDNLVSSFESGIVEIESYDSQGNKIDSVLVEIGEPLRGFPNSVQDQIIGNQLIRRIGVRPKNNETNRNSAIVDSCYVDLAILEY